MMNSMSHGVLRQIFVIIVIRFTLVGTTVLAQNWPAFRGPDGQGHSDEKGLPLTWSQKEGTNVLWSAPLKGQGHASPIVWNEKIVVCTVAWPADVTAREKVMPEHHVACYAAADGKLLWDTLVPPGPWLRSDFRSGPGGGYAAPTPATDGKQIYCLFGSSVLVALDFEGKIAWRKEIVPFTFDVTVGSSPVLFEQTVIVQCTMAKPADSRVVAFSKADGEIAWQQSLAGTGFGHSTPTLITVDGKRQLLVVASGAATSGKALQSLDPATGKPLWSCRGAGDVASAVYGSGLVYFDSGRGGLGTAVDPTGSGDVSRTHIKWTIPVIPEALGSPIVVGGHLYRLHTPGVLKCFDMATGKQIYSERLQGITTTWASPVADAEGHLIFASAGRSFVVQAGVEFKVISVNDLGDGSHPSAAISKGRVVLVGKEKVWCIGTGKR